MKILIITENFKTGGLETQIMGFCRYLKNSGYDVYLITGIRSRTFLLKEIIGENIFEVDMNPNLSTKEAINSINRIVSFIRQIEPDLLHLHPFTSIIYGGIAASLTDKPYVVTLHGPLSLTYGYSPTYRLFLEIILKDAWKVFCVSKEVSERLKLIVSNSRYVILPNAIDIDRFRPVQCAPDGAVAFVVRLDHDKLSGVKHFLKLWAFLPKELQKPVHIFGEGSAKQELVKWINEELVSHDWIILKGHEDNLQDVLTSGYSAIAGMGRVILEALAMELPAILVGYDGTKGLVNLDNIEDLAYRNFSGRYLPNLEDSEDLKVKNDVKIPADKQVYSVSKHKIEFSIGERYFPTEERLRAYLDRGGAEQCVMHMKQILSAVPELTEQDVICDIGCANGAGSKYLSENVKGTVLAFDLWNWPSDLLEYDVHVGLNLYDPSTWDMLPEGKTYILSHVIEHLEDPWAVLDKLMEIKRPSMVVINVPYNEVIPEGAKPPEHLHTFNGSELRQWAGKSDAKNVRISIVPIPGTDNHNLIAVFFFDGYKLSKAAVKLARELKNAGRETERSSLRKWVEEKADENKILPRYIEEVQNAGITKYWWAEPVWSSLGEAEDISLFGDKLFHCLLNNLPQDQSNYHWVNLYMADQLKKVVAEKESIWKQLNQTIAEKESIWKQLNQITIEKDAMTKELAQVTSEKIGLYDQLNDIYTSNFWKVASFYYRVRDNTPLRYVYRFFKRLQKKTREEAYNPYEILRVLKPIEVIVIDKKLSVKEVYPDFSVIIPVRNEGACIYDFLLRIKNQTLKPAEVIIVENLSEDNTIEEIKRFIKDYAKDLNIKLIVSKENSLAKNRNKGINEASQEILILLDAGLDFETDLFESLIATLNKFPEADLITGVYEPHIKNKWAKSFVWDWGSINFNEYIPSSKCLLIRKNKVLSIGGYPEFLPYTGEDTLLAIRYRKVSKKWIINKKIKVIWHAPASEKEALKKAYLYGWGDGLIGYGEFRFYTHLSYWLKEKKFSGLSFYNDVEKESFKGFLKGREERNEFLKDFIQRVWLILSIVPFTDSGGGQRGTQLALELMKNRNKVVFCNVYSSFEEKKEVFLDIEPELLELYSIKDFSIKDFIKRHRVFSQKMVILMEAPHPEFISVVDKIKKEIPSIRTIYDCIDNWDSTLGWIWYKRETEQEIINRSDLIIASAQTLKERLETMTLKKVYLIPNGVNTRVFNRNNAYEVSMPSDKPIIIYVGAMWGEWFDWELLDKLVNNLDINLVLIGNCPESKINELKKYRNVYYLGLKPQFELPAYLANARVGIIPFKYDDKIIKYTNPLKVYEYLAMGLPVVSIYMDELTVLPYVFLSKSQDEFIENVKKALNVGINYEDLKKIVENHSWNERVRKLIDTVEKN